MKGSNHGKNLLCIVFLGLVVVAQSAFAEGVSTAAVTTVTGLSSKLSGTFAGVVQLVTATSYVAGIGFSLGAIMKFKQHKDNPTQIPIGTPISMVFIAAALLFFPTILTMSGMSIFGTKTTAGTTGTIWGST
jgi:intracellular multiplication protein IcmD